MNTNLTSKSIEFDEPKLYSNKSPIFIAGIMTRSGTNFLYNLLELHPQCQGVNSKVMAEDHLIANSNLLERYVKNVGSYWCLHGHMYEKNPEREQENSVLQKRLRASLGKGLLDFLKSLEPDGVDKPLLTKTPNVRNLPYFFEFFPTARLIILIRDGRDVVESNVRSFGSNYEFTMQRWVEAAQTIIEFNRYHKNSIFSNQYIIIKYEDLLNGFDSTMQHIFSFLKLNPSSYDFEKSKSLPVFGSSENVTSTEIHQSGWQSSGWKVVEKKSDFKPQERWRSWPESRKKRFSWVAWNEMKLLGYSVDGMVDNNTPFSTFMNYSKDLQWKAILSSLSFIENVEKIFYSILRVRKQFKNFKME
ncbi:MAG: hypothetical protein GVY04_20175 [Cyanobacteria bacterium]|jgi:protein-tyrosine sulfotransferase|nr:hypothetical protein [Cyanobacteria bacterium GSL.Bin1]